jgi:hypothetical protein
MTSSRIDDLTKCSVSIAWIIAANKPFYPLYIWWLLGSGVEVSLITLIGLPVFIAIALTAGQSGLWARAALPIAGTIDTTIEAFVFGHASGTILFFAPCMMLAALSFRRDEHIVQRLAVAFVFTAFALTWWFRGAPAYPWSVSQLGILLNINALAVASLLAFIGLRYAGNR